MATKQATKLSRFEKATCKEHNLTAEQLEVGNELNGIFELALGACRLIETTAKDLLETREIPLTREEAASLKVLLSETDYMDVGRKLEGLFLTFVIEADRLLEPAVRKVTERFAELKKADPEEWKHVFRY